MSNTLPRLQRRELLHMVAGAALLLTRPDTWAATDAYPSRAVKIINNFAPGGPQDALIRYVAERLGKSLKQPFIVDYLTGAGGNIGAKAVAEAKPDGYSLLVTLSSTLEANPSLYPNVGFDALNSFSPITLLAQYGLVLVVNAKKPWSSVREMIDQSKKEALLYSSGGAGTPAHLIGEVFCRKSGASGVHVPFKGNAPAVMAVLSGVVSAMFSALPGALPHIRSGALRPLAVSGTERNKLLADVPTFSELGIDSMTQSFGHYLLAPKGMAAGDVATLQKMTTAALMDESGTTLLRNIGLDPASMTSEEAQKRIRDNSAFWKMFINDAGIKLE